MKYLVSYGKFAPNIRYIEIVDTENIFEYIGIKIYKTFEALYNIRWCEYKERDSFHEEYIEKGWFCITKNELYTKTFPKDN